LIKTIYRIRVQSLNKFGPLFDLFEEPFSGEAKQDGRHLSMSCHESIKHLHCPHAEQIENGCNQTVPALNPIDELVQLIQGPARAVVIAERDVDLRSPADVNRLFVLLLTEGSHAAGGRGGGFGERKVVRVALFRCASEGCEKLFETSDETRLAGFEVPFHVARMPMTLRDGTVSVGYGVVDPELVAELSAKTGSPA
jgi:hypothetical protein